MAGAITPIQDVINDADQAFFLGDEAQSVVGGVAVRLDAALGGVVPALLEPLPIRIEKWRGRPAIGMYENVMKTWRKNSRVSSKTSPECRVTKL